MITAIAPAVPLPPSSLLPSIRGEDASSNGNRSLNLPFRNTRANQRNRERESVFNPFETSLPVTLQFVARRAAKCWQTFSPTPLSYLPLPFLKSPLANSSRGGKTKKGGGGVKNKKGEEKRKEKGKSAR